MKHHAVILPALVALYALPAPVKATDPWPAESHINAVRLTDLDSGLNAANWSGAFWNPDTRTLWLACNNPGSFWALVEGGSNGLQVATNSAGTQAKWSPGNDLEAICQADGDTNLVYLMDENGWIREYNVANYGVVAETRNWDVRAICPEANGTSGGEGLAFIPDEYLRRQHFCDSNGVPYVSTNGMGGLMFIGYQADGFVYAFDLNRALNTFGFVGRYQTGRAETADLEFERATGRLFVWHNTGSNYLEVVELGSTLSGSIRRLRPLAEYYGPRTGNLEGFALVPNSPTNAGGGCILTDDDNSNREAVMWYRQFQPAADIDADGLADGWELWHFGSATQTFGSADSDTDRVDNASEQIAGTEPTNAASVLAVNALAVDFPNVVLSWPSVTGRTYAIRAAADPAAAYTNPVQTNIGETFPRNVATVDVSGLASNDFFRLTVEPP